MKNYFTSRMILAVVFILWITAVSFAQNEEKGFSFQGYARDFSGAAYSSQDLTAKFTIYPEGESNTYVEEQTIETDPYGVFQAVIGETRPADFGMIDFGAKNYFLKVEVRAPGDDFVEISNAQLLAVPYAKSSIKADTAVVAKTSWDGVPAGTILPFGGNPGNIPDGYLPCNGVEIAVDDYPALYDAIGDNWGGDGGTTFRTPDLRGQFMRGWNDGTGEDPEADDRTSKYTGGNDGDAVGSYQNDELKSHSHNYTDPVIGSFSLNSDSNGTAKEYPTTNAGTTTSTGGAETRPKNAMVMFMIKY